MHVVWYGIANIFIANMMTILRSEGLLRGILFLTNLIAFVSFQNNISRGKCHESMMMRSSICILSTFHAFVCWYFNSSWPHAFARIIARERRASHGPKSRVCWSPWEPACAQPPFPQDIWTLSSSVIRLALIDARVLARIWSISNH